MYIQESVENILAFHWNIQTKIMMSDNLLKGTDQPRKSYNKMPRIRPFSLVSDTDQGGK